MGTNFYLRRIPTEEELKSIHKSVDKKDFDEAKRLIDDASAEIHIGKRSSDWQFLFDISPEGMEISTDEFSLTKVKNYLEKMTSNYWSLQDEYEHRFTPDQFWEEINDCLYLDENHYDFYSYQKKREVFSVLYLSEDRSDDGLRYDIMNFS